MHLSLFSGVIGTFILSHLLGTLAYRQARVSGTQAHDFTFGGEIRKVVQSCVPITPLCFFVACITGLIINKCFVDEKYATRTRQTRLKDSARFRYCTRYEWKELRQTSPYNAEGNGYAASGVFTVQHITHNIFFVGQWCGKLPGSSFPRILGSALAFLIAIKAFTRTAIS